MPIGLMDAPNLKPNNLLTKVLQQYSGLVNAAYLPKEKQNSLQQSIAKTLIDQAQAKYADPMEQAKLAYSQAQAPYFQAQTNKINTMTPLDAAKQRILNSFLPQREGAEIDEIKDRGNYYQQGGGRNGVDTKNWFNYTNQVAKDNPHIANDPQKIREAADIYAQGGDTLSDGTKLNPMSFGTNTALSSVVKGTTTSGLINQSVKANQAASEEKVLSDLASTDMAPYATTFYGKSPEAIVDSFKNDDESQTRLGKAIAAQAAQYELAQIRNRIAGGEPGISATQELMKHSGQLLDLFGGPRLSGKARKVANDQLTEYLDKALAARNSVGVSASQLARKPSAKEAVRNEADKFNNEIIPMVSPSGEEYDVPAGKAQKFLENGYKRKN